eukprot:6175067-Pleurochrysis_carterae.AAC.3
MEGYSGRVEGDEAAKGGAEGINFLLQAAACRHDQADADAAADFPSKRRRGAVFRIFVNVRAASNEATAEAKRLRSELMMAWIANASLIKEQDKLATDLRGAAQRVNDVLIALTLFDKKSFMIT